MQVVQNVRNISVIAHVDHGKSTLSDSLVARAGIISLGKAGSQRFMDSRKDEQERGITIKSSAVSMYFEIPDATAYEEAKGQAGEDGFLINLIDSPGHADFSSEVTAALRVTDGAIVVVDCIDGVCVQTETVMRQAMGELIKPVVCLNKMDRALFELNLRKEELYQSFSRTIESVNVVLVTYSTETLGDCQIYPENGTVCFASAYQSWGFTLRQFATRYAAKFGVQKEKLMAKLWGENFFNHKTKKWTTKSSDETGEQSDRGFNMFVLDPIYQLFQKIMKGKKAEALVLLGKLGVELTTEEQDLDFKDLFKIAMRKFLPAADALLEMVCIHLPSPIVSQKYRFAELYQGPSDDVSAAGIRDCDPNGPLMIYISKMIPVDQNFSRFYAFGRVFSGTIKPGMKVRVQGPNYVHGSKTELNHTTIARVVLLKGSSAEAVEDCPAGNIIGLVGVDQYLSKTGTITNTESSHNLKVMKFSVSPVVQMVVSCKNAGDLPKLVEGIKKLLKSDPCVQSFHNGSKEIVIACVGELHLEICLNDLEVMAKCELKKGEPAVPYRETVTTESKIDCLSKSPNKHNRIYMRASPLEEGLDADIESGVIGPKVDFKDRARLLTDVFQWDNSEARKIWCFGPDGNGANVLVDTTTQVQYLQEIKDSAVSGFQDLTSSGPLTGEAVRSVRFNLLDVTLHADAIHRGAGQIMPTMRRVMSASILSASPAIQEPIYAVEITVPRDVSSCIYSVMNRRRGTVISEVDVAGTPMRVVTCEMPVNESMGFTSALSEASSGAAFAQCTFDRWKIMEGNPLTEGNKVYDIVRNVRKRNGENEDIPGFETYYDKL